MREFLDALTVERHDPIRCLPTARYGGRAGLEAAAAEIDAWNQKRREEAAKCE